MQEKTPKDEKKEPKKIKVLVAKTKAEKTLKTEKAEKAEKPKKVKKEKKPGLKLPVTSKFHLKPSYIVFAVFLVVFLAFFARVAIWEHNYLAAMEGSERDVVVSEVYEGEEPVETTQPTPTEVAEYKVAPDMPRYLTIPSLGITNARIVQVGLKANNEMDTPRNAYDIGWYNQSSLPGTNGVAMINAHGGNLGNGIFRNLPSIQPGAEIRVEMGDGRLYTYRVTDIETKPLGDEANAYMDVAFTSPEPGKGSVTLITCTGDWWQKSQTYSHRLFVRAVLE